MGEQEMRQRIRTILAAAAAFALAFSGGQGVYAHEAGAIHGAFAQMDEGKVFLLKNMASGKYLDVQGSTEHSENLANVQVYEKNGKPPVVYGVCSF